MRQPGRKLSPVHLAVIGAIGSLLSGAAVAAEQGKELAEINVSDSRDRRTVPLDLPAGAATRLGVPIKEIPASIEVIGQQTIQERGDRTVLEATNKATGFSGGFSGGTPGTFSVRGFHTNGVAWLYNGVRVPGGSSMSARIMDAANFDRIEVLRGPASVLHGEGSIGATVNLVSRAPSFVAQPIEVDYAYSSFNSHRFHAGTGGAIKDGVAAYRVDLSANHYGTNVNDERNALDRFTGSLLFKLSDALNLTLELDKMKDKADNAYWGTPLVNGKLSKSLRDENYNKLSDDRMSADTTWFRANLEWMPAGAWEVRNQFYYYDSFRDWRNVENYRYNAGGTVTRNSWGALDHDHQLVGNRLEALHKGRIGSLDNRFVIGTDFNRTDFKTKRNGFAGAAQTVDAHNPPDTTFQGPSSRLARDVEIDQWSIFAEDQLSLTRDLKLVGGYRHDRFETRWVYLDQAGAPREKKSHAFDSWRLGVVYDVTPGLTLYGSYATAVEPGGTLLLLNRNQSQLDLTTAKQAEIGLKQSFWGNRAEWTAAVYDIVKKNVFVPDPAMPTNRLAVGRQSSQGIELSLGLRPNDRWQFDANVATVHARYDDYTTGNPPISRDGNTPPFVPKWVANLGVRYSPVAQWTFGAWARHVAEVYMDDANTTKLPSYTTLDLSVDYKLDKRTDLGFRVRNATDELYAHWGYNGTSQALIADPRTYELSLRMRF